MNLMKHKKSATGNERSFEVKEQDNKDFCKWDRNVAHLQHRPCTHIPKS